MASIYCSIKSHITFVNNCICFILSVLLSQRCLKIFAKFVLENYTEGNVVFSSYCDLVEKKKEGLLLVVLLLLLLKYLFCFLFLNQP